METVCPYCDQFLDVPNEIEGKRTLKDRLNRRPTLCCG